MEVFAAMVIGGLSGAAGGVKVTPVVVHPLWEVSAEMGPLAAIP
jgi:hypothetical protein